MAAATIPKGTKSIICDTDGQHINIWCQEIRVFYTSIPLEQAKLLFEIYNRIHNEYQPDDDDDNPMAFTYLGLDNLEEEVIRNREKLQKEAKGKKSYSQIDTEGLGVDDEDYKAIYLAIIDKNKTRYGSVRSWVAKAPSEEAEDWFFRGIFEAAAIKAEHYYWLDQTRVTQKEYDAEADSFNHRYEVLELFSPDNFPIDFKDKEVVSTFGTDTFEALADLSYGC